MARIHDTTKSTLALRKRKRFLLSQIKVPPDALRASLVERFSRCGKTQCHCHHGGDKHGPFYYLTQCLAAGKINKFLLKLPMQRQAAMLGYIDAIYIFTCIAAVMAPAAFLMQKPAKGVKARSGH